MPSFLAGLWKARESRCLRRCALQIQDPGLAAALPTLLCWHVCSCPPVWMPRGAHPSQQVPVKRGRQSGCVVTRDRQEASCREERKDFPQCDRGLLYKEWGRGREKREESEEQPLRAVRPGTRGAASGAACVGYSSGSSLLALSHLCLSGDAAPSSLTPGGPVPQAGTLGWAAVPFSSA